MTFVPAPHEFVRPEFKKTAKQRLQLDLANAHTHTLAYGGARSAKSTGFVRNIFLRAMKKTSKHLMLRFRFNHADTSLNHETIPFVLEHCFPGAAIRPNKAKGYWIVPAADGGESEVWIGGTDNKRRLDKLLGSEYSTIFLNECSEIPFDAVPLLITRLAETSGLKLRMYYDCNPTGKKHWAYQMFFKQLLPDGEPCDDWDMAAIQMNPGDNLENLPPEFVASLEKLPKRQRQRFLEGLFLSDVDGALWTDQMINMAKAKFDRDGIYRKTIVAVDPSVTNNAGSDECGIVVCSLDEARNGVIRADLSKKCSTRTWAQRVVNAYNAYEANEIVAEVNNGGDLVEDAIHNIDPNIRVVKVRAAVGKLARAEPVSMLYEPRQERVTHAASFPELESELTETVLDDVKESPNRLDALVWGLTHLMVGKKGIRVHA